LKKYQALHLSNIAHEAIKKTPHDLIKRASAFLVLKDSRASFQIEDEYPEQGRAERWGQALGQAGRNSLTKEEILHLQKVVLESTRFVKLGFRQEGGFIGTHDRLTGMPIPDHISARWEDLERLMDGMIAMYQQLINKEISYKENSLQEFSLQEISLDPIILAACIAFGFVFIHPLADGNGRIHRYLIQHILVQSGFVSQGFVLAISAVILERIEEYKCVLEAHSTSRLGCIDWKPTDHGNVEVLNETIDLYRYFDATKQVEFLYDCINQAITQSLPEEIDYLMRYDRMKLAIKEQFDMPEYVISLLIRFLEQGHGKLSKRSMNNEFKALSLDECKQLEELYADIFKK
jgi:Fic family protein